jgi:hypothetical protein
MVEPAQERNANERVSGMWRWSRRRWWLGQVLPEALMWSCLIEGGHTLIERTLELLLVEDQQVIQAFATNAAEKPFTDGVRSWGLIRCYEEFDGGRGCHTRKT